MRHYSVSELLLFVRDGLPDALRQAVDLHLQGDCPACQETYQFALHLSGVTARDRNNQPPPEVLETARQIMRNEAQTVWSFAEPVSIPVLVFDNLAGLLATGRRASVLADRHLVFREGSLLVDVHLEADEAGGILSIAGQVQIDPAGPSAADSVSGWPVLLVDGPRVLRSSQTGLRGEFLLNSAAPLSADLIIVAPEGTVKITRTILVAA